MSSGEREISLITKFVVKFLTRYLLTLEIIAAIDCEVCARPVSVIPNEPSPQPYEVDTIIRPIFTDEENEAKGSLYSRR